MNTVFSRRARRRPPAAAAARRLAARMPREKTPTTTPMRKCNCSGGCGPHDDGLTRREFIGMAGAGTATLLFAPRVFGAWQLPQDELERWKRSLREPAPPRVYRSDRHTDARMHLGGIGTGNLEIGADGQLTTWQLFNTLRDGQVPLYFGVRTSGGAKLLQTTGGPDWARVQRIEMTGEYPLATLRFFDPQLPVDLDLRAFTPFAPLDALFSAAPLAAFVFRLHNPTPHTQTVALAAFMQNPVGYDAAGKVEGVAHPNFGANVNEPFHPRTGAGLVFRANAGREPTLDTPVTIYASANVRGLETPPVDRPKNLTVRSLDPDPPAASRLPDPRGTLLWLEEARPDLPEPTLRAAQDAVQGGATLVFSGRTQPLLALYAEMTGGKPLARSAGRPDILFEDFGFSDLPASRTALQLLEALLPARFSAVRQLQTAQTEPNTVQFDGLALLPEATPSAAPNGLRLLTRPLGKGRVVVCSGPVLDPAEAELSGARQRAYALLCSLVGAHYVPPDGPLPTAPGFGTLALVSLAGDTTVETAFDNWDDAWDRFADRGEFTPIRHAKPGSPTPPGRTTNGAVAATVKVHPGKTVDVPFLLAWHYPNKYNHAGVWMGCDYARRWADAPAVATAAAASFAAWRERTERFHQAFYDSTLPYWLLDCLTSQAATIRHVGVVFRIANDDLYGWEGSNGCCEPTCTHVWGYEQSLARLFPDLEKEMRRIDFTHQQRPDGGVNNRTALPSPPHPTGEHPFTDGHASCVLKAYREALNSPDRNWMNQYWPHVKRAVEYLIARDAAAAGGGEPAGILQDDQWNTYDEALHGVTTFIGTYYLAALRAGVEWAKQVGDFETALRFHNIFTRGSEKLTDLCWNGDYFQQHLPDYLTRSGEVGPGCMSDQLIGQWWAHQLGLGYLLPKEKVQSALRAVFKYNWKSDLTGWKHWPRAFAGAKDKGLIVCTWPRGGRPPRVMLYSDEVWTGIEYQVAAHMIYEGMLDEGLAIVKGARDRYDGLPRPPIPRNPWNEIECGGHYARAMSSWSLLLALSGFRYHGPEKRLWFNPRLTPTGFQTVFTGPAAWGVIAQRLQAQTQAVAVTVLEGTLPLAKLHLAPLLEPTRVEVALGAETVPATLAPDAEGVEVSPNLPVFIEAGQTLALRLT